MSVIISGGISGRNPAWRRKYRGGEKSSSINQASASAAVFCDMTLYGKRGMLAYQHPALGEGIGGGGIEAAAASAK